MCWSENAASQRPTVVVATYSCFLCVSYCFLYFNSSNDQPAKRPTNQPTYRRATTSMTFSAARNSTFSTQARSLSSFEFLPNGSVYTRSKS